MKHTLFIFTFFGFAFTFTIENIIIANSIAEEMNFKFHENEEEAILSTNNALWIVETDYGYDIMYDSFENIAGFQFNIAGLDYDDFEYINGESQKNNFILQRSKEKILGFSFDGKTLPTGTHTLLEIRNLDIKKNELKSDKKKLKTIKKNDIDLTNIVVSDNKGNGPKVNLICHKSLCKDHNYRYTNDYKEPDITNDLITISLKTADTVTWEVYYESNFNIGGYQFDVEGAEIISAYGGESAKNAFTISTNNETILAFSFKGDFIPAGKGKLLEFEVR